jgi:uncharacterized protein YbjT (DUF2867 family)
MRILLTGASGYIGKRLLPALIAEGHEVFCIVRDKDRFNVSDEFTGSVRIIEGDLLKNDLSERLPEELDAAYYLVHSMSSSEDYEVLEATCAKNFRKAAEEAGVKHVIYLSGLINESKLSKHLQSRKRVENELSLGKFHLTTLRAGIVIGSGSASFEIVRDLVEKLPFMVAPKWLNTNTQPISVRDVIQYLVRSLLDSRTYDRSFDIGGTDVMTYKTMLQEYAQFRGLRRPILIVPVLTPRLSSYWLIFITSTSYKLARALVGSLEVEMTCKENDLENLLQVNPASFQEALEITHEELEGSAILSSWKDSMVSGRVNFRLADWLSVPTHGCFTDSRRIQVPDPAITLSRIWRIGGKNGWYFATWLWTIRGFLDKLIGGVGLRRGRTNQNHVNPGDAIDFWRVLLADKEQKRLLLVAEMKLPGKAWLEFRIRNGYLEQTATFRPLGILGRFYWYAIYPLHAAIFQGMITRLSKP